MADNTMADSETVSENRATSERRGKPLGEISETVSQKPKRGRPPIMSPDQVRLADRIGLFVETTTRRGRNNIHYRSRALSVLGNAHDPEFFWLCNGPEMMKDGGQRTMARAWRPSILIELGRIDDDETLLAMARRICELKPRAHEAVTMIRRFRLGRSKPGDAVGLAREIRRFVNGYLSRHPDTEWAEVLQALATVTQNVRVTVEAQESSATA